MLKSFAGCRDTAKPQTDLKLQPKALLFPLQ
jgi:hypothetical protein